MDTAVTIDLSNQYAKFIDAVARGLDPTDAAMMSGFPEPAVTAARLLQQPVIRKALVAAAAARLEAEALPLAMAAAIRILGDLKTPAAVAAKLALGVMDRTGVGAKAENPTNPQNDIDNMTEDELVAYIDARADNAKPMGVARLSPADHDDES